MIWNLVLLVSIPSAYARYIVGRLFILTTYRSLRYSDKIVGQVKRFKKMCGLRVTDQEWSRIKSYKVHEFLQITPIKTIFTR